MVAINFVDFEISREKGDFLKNKIGHLGLNRGSKYLNGLADFRKFDNFSHFFVITRLNIITANFRKMEKMGLNEILI